MNLGDSFDSPQSHAIEIHFDAQLLDILRVSPRAVGFEELTTALLALVALSVSTMSVFSCLRGVTLRTFHLSIVPNLALPFQQRLAEHLKQMGIANELMVEFIYLPPYSPKLNLVEYVIHLLRLRFLHHLPIGTSLEMIEQQLEQFLQSHQFLTTEQVQKTLNFIFTIVT
jgi:transposase